MFNHLCREHDTQTSVVDLLEVVESVSVNHFVVPLRAAPSHHAGVAVDAEIGDPRIPE